MGRTLAYRSSVWRKVTFTDLKPLPMGVPMGPLRATRFFWIESSTSCGSVVPAFSATPAPALCTSQSMATPEASSTRWVAAHTSGPMPSPGINVMVCFKCFHL